MSIVDKLERVLEKWETRKEQIELALKYLKYYGYIKEKVGLEEIFAAVRAFQRLAGLVTDGEIGPKTLKAMEWPRCGCTDAQKLETAESKWGTRNLTYYIESRDNDLSAQKWDELIEQAYQQWADVANLKFTRTNSASRANFILGVGSGRRDNFDGPSGTLAWHQLPPGNSYNGRLRGMFDAAETWVDDPRKRGILLLNVACHEIGHGLGLDHSRVNSALMAPFYSPNVPAPVERDDITRIRRLYGAPTGGGNPPPNPTVPAPTNLTAQTVDDDEVRLRWEDNSTGEDRFEIYRNGNDIGSVGRGNTSAKDVDVPEGLHEYQVRAVKDGVASAWSNKVTVVVGNPNPPDPTNPELVIKVTGQIEDVEIPGYRVTKIG